MAEELSMLELRRATDRGVAEFGWLHSRHTFSFGNYYDPFQQGFSDLRVINDDVVDPGMGFGSHAHHDMEIFSYVLDGALAHKDSMGIGSIIHPGDVQMMSAGNGVQHSEFNPSKSDPVHFLQIWIVPNRKGVEPRYQQQQFSDDEKRGRLRLIVSPDGALDSLSVHQDVRVYAGLFDADESATFTLAANRYAYVHVARGSVHINDVHFDGGDGARLRAENKLRFELGQDAEVLLFDLRAREKPQP
jgi:redox-sensitive bicupin YhaK (pirin superfamily)